MAISPDERYAYVASIREGSLVRIDLNTGVVVDPVKTGRFPREALVSVAAYKLYVLNGVDDTIPLISIAEWSKVLATLPLSDPDAGSEEAFGQPLMMWLSKDGERLFTNSAGKTRCWSSIQKPIALCRNTRWKISSLALCWQQQAMAYGSRERFFQHGYVLPVGRAITDDALRPVRGQRFA